MKTKGGKPRTVPVNKELRSALQAYRTECRRTGDDDVLFKCRHAKPGEPMSANAVTAWFRDLYVRRLGWTGYSSHSGRRTFATQAARKATTVGGSLRDVHSTARARQPDDRRSGISNRRARRSESSLSWCEK